MGCDIHAIAQIKRKDNWETIGQLDIDRDYELFNILAGVRGDGADSISEPRGLPEDFRNIGYHIEWNYDINTSTLLDGQWDLGDHSYSYITLKELTNKRILKKLKEKCWCSDENNGIFKFIKEYSKGAKRLKIKLEDIRIVFGFDS